MYDNMQANILPLPGEVKRSKHSFLLKVVMLHIKLTGRYHGHHHVIMAFPGHTYLGEVGGFL